MRYRTFRAIVLCGVAGLGVAGFLAYDRFLRSVLDGPGAGSPSPVATAEPASFATPSAVAVPSSAPATSTPEPGTVTWDQTAPLGALDHAILERLGKEKVTDAHVKDLLPSRAEKVSAYTDAGWSSANRIKIAHDRRSDVVDEKWELNGLEVTKRLVSTRKDGVFDEVWARDGDRWVRKEKGAKHADDPAPTPAPTRATPAPTALASAPPRIPLRALDRSVIALLGKPAQGDKVKDALGKGSSAKVNLSAENGSRVWNHAKVDVNRNDKWDEKWDLNAAGKIKRKVAPGDDEVYTQEFRLDGDAWIEEKP